MTHSLHRQGSVESLKEDYVVLIFYNVRGFLSTLKKDFRMKFPRVYGVFKKFLSKPGITQRFKKGRELKESKEEFKKTTVLHSRKELGDYLKRLKEANTGHSVVVSGLIDEVDGCLKEIGLRMHTIQFSLGYFGKTELLPSEKTLEITTMCGHHLVSTKLVEKLTSEIEAGRITHKEAAEAMGNLCTCEIFNKDRAAKILEGRSSCE